MIETNIDDMSSEIYSYIFPMLFDKGALDVYLTNIIMKKNRPGVKLSILCKEDDTKGFEDILFRETTTLGIRKYKVDREILHREFTKVNTKYGVITLKKGIKDGEVLKYAPEYEECKEIALKYNLPVKDVYNEILRTINKI